MNDTYVKTQPSSKHNNKHLIKDTVREMGTKRTMTASKMTVSNVKQQQYCNYNSDTKYKKA